MPISAPVAVAGLSAGAKLLGGGGNTSTSANLPPDLVGPRKDALALLQYLLGYGSGQPGGGAPQGPRSGGVAAHNPSNWPSGYRGAPPGALPAGTKGADSASPSQGLPNFGEIGGRLQSFFGPLGVPQSDLQRQATGGFQQLIGSDPQQSALLALQKMFTQNPGQGVLDALQPKFQQNLASANQEGARFSSGNEILRSRAVNDYNLLSATALQHGVDQQQQAAQLAQQLLAGAYGVGTAGAQQADIETQRRLQILMSLLGAQQGATLGAPTTTTTSPSFYDQARGLTTDTLGILNALNGVNVGV